MNAAWDQQAWTLSKRITGVDNMIEAFDMCRDGWPEGAARVARMRDRINTAHPIGPRLVHWDIAGAYPSVARALAGNPMNMRRLDSSRTRRKPVITIVHHMGGIASVAADTFTNKAAVMAAIIDAIEGADFQVELIAVSLTRGIADEKFAHETAFTVKEAGQPVDIGRLAFGVGHVAAFRRLVFATRSLNHANAPLTNSLGRTLDYAQRPEGVYVLPSLNTCESHFRSETEAETQGLAFFISQLAAQGCPAFPQLEAA